MLRLGGFRHVCGFMRFVNVSFVWCLLHMIYCVFCCVLSFVPDLLCRVALGSCDLSCLVAVVPFAAYGMHCALWCLVACHVLVWPNTRDIRWGRV